MSDIKEFQGEARFLSNFISVRICYDGVVYPSVENAYQAAKCMLMDDRAQFKDCLAHEAKRLGKIVPMRSDWNKIKESVMYELVKQKFTEHPTLREKLLATGECHIEEGNRWGDTYWGVDIRTGEGDNRLGQMLMDIRSDLETDFSIDIATTYPQQHNLSDDSKAVLLQHYFS